MEQDKWIGYKQVLGNGNKAALSNLEKFFGQGIIGRKNTTGLYIEEVFDRDNFVADENGNPMDGPPKIIYAHPSEVPYSPGDRISVSYSGVSVGRYNTRKISDSAVLFVDNEPPMTNGSLDGVKTFLAGDKEDRHLKDRGIRVQAYPFMV